MPHKYKPLWIFDINNISRTVGNFNGNLEDWDNRIIGVTNVRKFYDMIGGILEGYYDRNSDRKIYRTVDRFWGV